MTNAAFRLSALAIAAGTVLGLSSHALAQSRLERAERALERAQKELEAARQEQGLEKGADKGAEKNEIRCEVNCNGCESGEEASGDEHAIRVDLTTDDDEEEGEQPRRIERRIEVRRQGQNHVQAAHGGMCPMCGRPMEGGGGAPMGGLFGPGPMKVFGLGGTPFRVQTQGKVIILDDKGQRREFNFGGPGEGHGEGQAHGQAHAFVIRGDGDEAGHGARQERRIEIRREGGEGGQFFMEGDGLKKQRHGGEGAAGEPRIFIQRNGLGDGQGDGKGDWQRDGEDGPRHIQRADPFRVDGGGMGKIIIITPDGQRREIDLGGKGGQRSRVQIHSFGDGDGAAEHLDGAGDRTIRVRRLQRGSAL